MVEEEKIAKIVNHEKNKFFNVLENLRDSGNYLKNEEISAFVQQDFNRGWLCRENK